MRNGISLSQKHGVNPSLLVCAVCGESSGVALLGLLPNDKEAPRSMLDREPCKVCQSKIDDHAKLGFMFYVILDEFDQYAKTHSPWQFFHSYQVLKNERAREILPADYFAKGRAFIPLSVAKQIGLMQNA